MHNIRWREIFWPASLGAQAVRVVVYAVFAVLLVLALAGCDRTQNPVVVPCGAALVCIPV